MNRLEPHEVAIRLATPADAPQLAALRYRFRAGLGAPVEEEGAFVARASAWFATRLALPTWRCWLAVAAEDALIGQILLQLIEKVPNPVAEAETIGYITNLYVQPEQRGRGIGGRLLQMALAACPAETVDSLILWPTPQSVSLYERLGFSRPIDLMERRQRHLVQMGAVDKPLPGPAPGP
jgi:ribosomal protein S18 acetylase RimI-like enzyme